MVRGAGLWCRRLPEGREFEAGLHHPTTGKLSLFELGKEQAAKGEGWALPFMAIRLWEIFIFLQHEKYWIKLYSFPVLVILNEFL